MTATAVVAFTAGAGDARHTFIFARYLLQQDFCTIRISSDGSGATIINGGTGAQKPPARKMFILRTFACGGNRVFYGHDNQTAVR